MKIYHYTSIETLALILHNKTIRFNRLDGVDDVEEAAYASGTSSDYGIRLGQYVFASCWTKDEMENLALWNMYTNYKGVRIALDEDMFITYESFGSGNGKYFFEKPFDVYKDGLIVSISNPATLFDVKYVDNQQEEIKKLVSNGEMIGINNGDAGLFKRKEWSFQKECRFKLFIPPLNYNMLKRISPNDVIGASMMMVGAAYAALQTNRKLTFNHIDMPLKDSALENIEIMMGPKTSEADFLIVNSLLKGLPLSKVSKSSLWGNIRK